MKNRTIWHRLPIHLVLLFCISCFSQSVVSAGKDSVCDANNLCARADAFMKEEMYDQAIAKYEAVLKQEKLAPGLEESARKGLIKATQAKLDKICDANNLCATADAFMKVGMYDQAIAKYEAVLKQEKLAPGLEESAREGLIKATKAKLDKNCSDANSKIEEGLLSEAEALFKKLDVPTASEEEISCARKGLEAVAVRYENNGEKYERQGDVAAAEVAYEAATKACKNCNACDKCLARDVKLRDFRHTRKINELASLVKLGLEDEAKGKLKTYVNEDPTFGQKADDFAFFDRPHVPLWTEIRKARIDTAPLFVASLPHVIRTMPVIEALILALFIGLIGRKFSWWGTPTLNIKDISEGKKGDEVNAEFTAEMAHQLMDFNTASRASHQILLVSAPISPDKVDYSASIPIATGWLNNVLKTVLPSLLARPSLAVTGLLKEGQNGTIDSLTIQIDSGNRIFAKHTIAAREFGLEKDNQDLAICAAVWILFVLHTTQLNYFSKLTALLRRIACRPEPNILGTSDWETYAWFALGVKWGQRIENDQAKAAYLRALTFDPKFLASRVNLAGVYQRAADLEDCDQDKKVWLLECAYKQLETFGIALDERQINRDDPTLYTGLFLRAAICHDLSDTPKGLKKREYLKEANKAADDLVIWISNMLEAKSRIFLSKRVIQYLEWRLPVAESMRLGLKIKSLPPSIEIDSGDKKDLSRVSKILSERVDIYSLYNLSCTYAMFADREKKPTEGIFYPDSLIFLQRSLEYAASIGKLGSGFTGTLAKVIARVKNDLSFKSFRGDPDFQRVITRFPLPPDSGKRAAEIVDQDGFEAKSQTS